MTRLNPSEVRQRILDQHQALREHLDELQTGLESSAAAEVIKGAAKDVYEELLRHIADEEENLLPELLEADGWGAVRVAALQEEHVAQRALLGALVKSIKSSDSDDELSGHIKALILRIRKDMDEEEKTHLTKRVLKDDIIAEEPGT
jgi:iron-sulfur cluster repair protein YtfE (RIC family)